MRRAVIDVGSNSVILLVAESACRGWRTVYETSRVTGLGRGTKTSGRLCPEGAADTLDALRTAFAAAREHGAEEVRAAGTMALRIADDRDGFLAAAAAQGTPVDVLSGEEEADLGFRSVADDPLFADRGRLSIIDPGGHSTELVTADRVSDGWALRFRRSFPIGALGLREGPLADPSPDFRARLAAVGETDDTIGLQYLPAAAGTAIVLGATGTNLVSIRERLTAWQPERIHGATLDYEEVSKAVAAMCDLDDGGRAALVGIEPGRERTIHVGALILERFLHALHVPDCRVSVRGWRHALLESAPQS